MPEEQKYVYGPVPSRRLGRSLGIDIIPFKLCTLDCVYCQLGRSTRKTIERSDYVPIEPVLAELTQRLADGVDADFITVGGSGEPTLNSQLGKLVKGIKEITNIPVAILTNGTLLYREDVRADCAKAEVVLPSLDAGDAQTFRKINRPHRDISIEKLVSGLRRFREEFTGQVWLEVFVVEGLNTDIDQITKIRGLIERIRPDKIHLNTAVRPTADAQVSKVRTEKLQVIARHLGTSCEVVADFPVRSQTRHFKSTAEDLLSMLKRRPCSLKDVCAALGIGRNEAIKHISYLQHRGLVDSDEKNQTIFFKAN
jgi:wyosine [tRNA(Phe)-imidazoG37] synthetase (radical SAM superfamily)